MNIHQVARVASVAALTVVLALSLSAPAFAASTVRIGDPVTDTVWLWTVVANAIVSLEHGLSTTVAFHYGTTNTSPTQKTFKSPTVAAAVVGTTILPVSPQAGTPSNNDSDTAVTIQNSQPGEVRSITSKVATPAASPLAVTPASSFVTQAQLNAALSALSASVRQLTESSTFSASATPMLGGGAPNTIAAASNIGQLSGVTITSATISGGTFSNVSLNGVSGLTTSDLADFGYATTSELYAPTNLAAWGDSLTDGSGQTPYTTYLTQLYGGSRYVYNFGVGGDTSTQIETRMLAYPVTKNLITVIWAGRNDIGVVTNSTIESNIAAMVASLGTNQNYLILSVLNASTEPSGSAGYIQITQLNSDLATLYPGHYFDIREYLVQHGLSDAGITPSGQDLTDIGNDVPPTDLRINTLHLTSAGYSVVAQQVYNFVSSTLGITAPTTSTHVLTQANVQSLFSSPWAIGLVTPNAGSFTDLNAQNFKTSGVTVLYSSSTNASTYVGIGAGTELYATTTPKYNTALGYEALGNTFQQGGSNVSIGYQSMFLNATGTQNVAVGNLTLQANTSGFQNTAVGYGALLGNTTGNANTAVGYQALFSSNTAADNIAVGGAALRSNLTGNANTAVGFLALQNNKSATTSVAVGYRAGYGTVSFYSNQGSALLGYAAGQFFQTGSDYNTLIGYQSGNGITTGADNVLIGASLNSNSYNQVTTGSSNIAIGYNLNVASSTLSNQLNIGNIVYGTNIGVVSTGKLGIGTTTPYSRFEVWGTDTASTTAFLVANSASTTEFAVYDTGNATLAGGLIQNSDQRLKTNIQSLDASSSLSLIDQLNPVTFNWIDPNKGMAPQLGFIAQQILPIFPNLVSTTSPTILTPDGTLSLNYIDLISPIVSAIQALSREIADIENTIAGFALSITSQRGNFTNELCVGSTCVSPAQFQAIVSDANASQGGGSGDSPSGDASASSTVDTPPVISINGNNPAIVQVGATYNDLGATITGPQADLNLGITTFLNGTLTSNIVIDTSQPATDTINYVATDQNGLSATSTRVVIVEAVTSSPSTQ